MRRLALTVAWIVAVASTVGLTAPRTEAVGACIGPISKTATFTYTDRSAYIQDGGPIRYAKFKMTARVCHDSLGNVWATSLPSWSIPSGSTAFWGIASNSNVAVTHGVRGQIHAVFVAATSLHMLLHVRPWITATESGGVLSWTKGSFSSWFATEGGLIIHDYDPIPMSSVWN